MSALRCESLTKSFGAVRVLDGVSLAFPGSTAVALVGPNGSGKTTLLNVLTGFTRADSGRCFVGDRDTTRMPAHRIARQGVARTFQNVRLIRQCSALENVLLAQSPPGQPRDRRWWWSRGSRHTLSDHAASALATVGLEAMAGTKVEILSYGQQKLLALACCVAMRASVLLLDEPIAGVDPDMAARIGALIARLRQSGHTIVFVEHDLVFIRGIADRVVVLHRGRVMTQGAAADVLERPDVIEAYIG